ncbi:MAG: hypothetical protein AAGA83_21930 [Cyanobacteria bacterium P01_F01_bin.116]
MTHLDPKAGSEQATFLPPSGSVSNPAGFVATAITQSNHTLEVKRMMAQVAMQLTDSSTAMEEFCDRVHQLLRHDLQSQQERASGRRH